MSDSQILERIIKHMNKDHVHNLEDYLVVFGQVDLDMAKSDPKLDTMDLSSMTVSFLNDRGGRTFVRIPFEQRLETFRDARGQFVSMAAKAAKKRGFSEYIVNTVPKPTGTKDIIGIALFGTLWAISAKPEWAKVALTDFLHLGSSATGKILEYAPYLFKFLTVAHSMEAMLILYPLIRSHRMSIFNKVISLALTLVNGIIFIKAYKREITKVSTKASKDA